MNPIRNAPAAFLGAALSVAAPAVAQEETGDQVIKAAVLRVAHGDALPISRLDLPPEDLGFAGGTLGTMDNQTTGQFMGQTFETSNAEAAPDGVGAEVERLIGDGVTYIIVLGAADEVLAASDAAGDRALVFNADAPDDRLRNDDCRANVWHIVPSRAMTADALAQFLMWKRWDEWFLIEGSHPGDKAMADAYRRAAKKFGAEIVDERVFEDTGGARRTDSGHVQVQKQMPVFTQRAEDHEVIIAVDETDYFAQYLPYQTWDPRPVAGSAGLTPVTWHPAQEAWGATQMQTRFEDLTGRYMREVDMNVWLALRVIGEGATRTSSSEFDAIRDYILSDKFELAAFKGQKVTFRDWNHQLRQPIILTHDKVLVSVSPQEEYLHQVSRLDTLGYDRAESTCSLN